jgi:hypothetical protein
MYTWGTIPLYPKNWRILKMTFYGLNVSVNVLFNRGEIYAGEVIVQRVKDATEIPHKEEPIPFYATENSIHIGDVKCAWPESLQGDVENSVALLAINVAFPTL